MYNLRAIYHSYLAGTCSPEQAKWLLSTMDSDEYHEEWHILINEELYSPVSQEEISNHIQKLSKDQFDLILSNIRSKRRINTLNLHSPIIKGFVAALLLIVGSLFLWIFVYKSDLPRDTPIGTQIAKDTHSTPSMDRATITLADGNTVYLEEDSIGLSRVNLALKEEEGEKVYHFIKSQQLSESVLQTIYVPKGDIRRFVLVDGTKVWLNSDSRITFDLNQVGNYRKVELLGEGYFEVTHSEKPFIVSTGSHTVEVLGTKFNISAYSEQSQVRTTLFDGSVKVSYGSHNVTLLPGRESLYSVAHSTLLSRKADLDQVAAWRKFEFSFLAIDIESIVNILSRWYNIEFEILGDTTGQKFTGSISKRRDLNEILDMLQRTNQIKYKIIAKTNGERRVQLMM